MLQPVIHQINMGQGGRFRSGRFAWASLIAGLLLTLQVATTASADQINRLADQEIDEVIELYSAKLDGSAVPVKLNSPLTGGKDVFNFQISPDSSRMIYLADQESDEVFELFVSDDEVAAPPAGLIYLPLLVRE